MEITTTPSRGGIGSAAFPRALPIGHQLSPYNPPQCTGDINVILPLPPQTLLLWYADLPRKLDNIRPLYHYKIFGFAGRASHQVVVGTGFRRSLTTRRDCVGQSASFLLALLNRGLSHLCRVRRVDPFSPFRTLCRLVTQRPSVHK